MQEREFNHHNTFYVTHSCCPFAEISCFKKGHENSAQKRYNLNSLYLIINLFFLTIFYAVFLSSVF